MSNFLSKLLKPKDSEAKRIRELNAKAEAAGFVVIQIMRMTLSQI